MQNPITTLESRSDSPVACRVEKRRSDRATLASGTGGLTSEFDARDLEGATYPERLHSAALVVVVRMAIPSLKPIAGSYHFCTD